MNDISNLISEITATLARADRADRDLVFDIATEYSNACVEVNSRLNTISDLLARGLRSEAFQVAEQEPDVMNVLSRLDFPEYEQWLVLLSALNLDGPPPLDMYSAELLNEAYSTHSSIDSLIRKNHLLALDKAPHWARLNVLRKLLTADPTNRAWQDDQTALEKVRIRQILPEAREAESKKDFNLLINLQDELKQNWNIKIPENILVETKLCRKRVEMHHARAEIARQNIALNQALAEFNPQMGRAARTKWDQLALAAQLNEGEPLFEDAQEAFHWLDEEETRAAEEDRYQQLIMKLERAIDQSAPVEQIDATVYEINRLGRDLPVMLANRYTQYVGSKRTQKQARMMITVGSIVAVLALVGFFVFSFVSAANYKKEVDSALANLKRIEEGEDYDALDKFVLALDPSVAQEPTVVLEIEKLSDRKIAEVERLESMREFLEAAKSKGLDNPDFESIESATKLAVLDSEKLEIKKLENRIEARQLELQEDRNSDFVAKLEKLKSEFKSHRTDSEYIKGIRAEVQALRSQGNSMVHRVPVVAPSLVSQSTSLDAQIVKQVSENVRIARRKEEIDALKLSANFELFGESLKRFADRHTTSPYANDFLYSAGQVDLLNQLNDARKLVKQIQLEARLWKYSEIETYQEKVKQNVFLKQANSQCEFGVPETALLDLLQSRFSTGLGDPIPLVDADLDMFKDRRIKNVSIAYLLEKPELLMYLTFAPASWKDSVSSNLSYYTGFSESSFPESKKIEQKDKKRYEILMSAQSMVSQRVVSHLEKIDEDKSSVAFESGYLKAIYEVFTEKAVTHDRKMDPVLKVILLQSLVTNACQGSDVLSEYLGRYRDRLKNPPVDLTANWIKPGDANAVSARSRANQFLSSELGLTEAELKKINSLVAKESEKTPTLNTLNVLGWYLRDDRREPSVRDLNNVVKGSKLFVIDSNQGDRPFLKLVGEYSNQVPSFNKSNVRNGQVIFALSE